jgi:hypothetical protein
VGAAFGEHVIDDGVKDGVKISRAGVLMHVAVQN